MAGAQDKKASQLSSPVAVVDSDCWAGYRPAAGVDPNIDLKISAELVRAPMASLTGLAAGTVPVASIGVTTAADAVSGLAARTAESKLRELPSPEDYGAPANGTDDDSVAILKALTAKQRIRLTPGKVYKLTAGISIPSDGCEIHSQGAQIINGRASGTMFAATGRHDFVVSGVDFRGIGASHTAEASAIIIAGTSLRAKIRHCHFKDFYGVAVKASLTDYTSISDNYFGATYNGVGLNWTTTNYLLIDSNIFYELGTGPNVATTNNAMSGINTTGTSNNKKTIVRNNTIAAVGRMGIEIADSEDLLVEGNVIWSSVSKGISVPAPVRGIIRRNRIMSSGSNAIEVTSGCDYVQVIENHIRACTGVSIILDMQSSGQANHAKVISNTLESCTPGQIGIRLLAGTAGNADHIQVRHNTLFNAGGIEHDTSAGSFNRISDNTVIITENGHSIAFRLRGISTSWKRNHVHYASGLTGYTTAISPTNMTSPDLSDNTFVGNGSPAKAIDATSSSGCTGVKFSRNRIAGATASVDFGTPATVDEYVDNTCDVAPAVNPSATGMRRDLQAVVTAAAQSATPSVLGVGTLITANTSALTITSLTNGYVGQEVMVVINDAFTSVDFTGTTLKGNAGVDWTTPGVGATMRCRKTGTNWYCTVTPAAA